MRVDGAVVVGFHRLGNAFNYSASPDELEQLEVCVAEASQTSDQGDSATSLMARAFAAPLERRQLRRHSESVWAGYGNGWVGSLSLWPANSQLCLRGSTVQGELVMGMVPFAQTLEAGRSHARSESGWDFPLVFAGDSTSRHALAAHLPARCSVIPFAVSALHASLTMKVAGRNVNADTLSSLLCLGGAFDARRGGSLYI
jgi:hypothetical protein